MNTAGLRRGLAVSAVAGLAFGLTAIVGSAPAMADSGPTTLGYKCVYPLLGSKPISLKVSTNIPQKIQLGVSTQRVQVKWTASLGADTVEGLQAVDGVSIAGVAKAKSKVVVPEYPNGLDVPVTNALAPTPIPAAGGPLNIEGYGEAPALGFTQAGAGTAVLGDMELNIVVKKADGTSSALGAFKSACTPNTGQDLTVAKFDIVNDAQPAQVSWERPSFYPGAAPTDAPGTLNYKLALAGTSVIKAANGTVPINGSINVAVDGVTGAIKGDLALDKSVGQMSVLGFLPVTPEVAFEQVGQTTGSFANGEINTTSTMYVRFANFKLFGGLPIGGGDKCQTKTPAVIAMHSTKGVFFNPKKGGPFVADNYTLSELADCGPLTGIIGLFAAGSGNTITAALKPKA